MLIQKYDTKQTHFEAVHYIKIKSTIPRGASYIVVGTFTTFLFFRDKFMR